MLEKLANVFRVPDLRKRILFTLGLLAVYRLGGFAAFRAAYHEWGLWIILIKGLTPIPYKLVTIASGVAKFDIAVFVAASVATRGARFFLIAALLLFYGAPIQAVIEKHLGWVALGLAGVIIGGIVAAKFLV